MTANSVPAASDPRRLLTDLRALAQRVRIDQRMTGATLLVLATATLAAIPFDWFFLQVRCGPDGGCEFARNGMLFYWPAAALLAYAVIAVIHLRAARSRGVGTRVLPYAITGAVTSLAFPAGWLAVSLYLSRHPVPETPTPYWGLVLDRLVMPWGMIGVSLLVLAWLERRTALALFTAGYLALVLLILPMNTGLDLLPAGLQAQMAAPQLIAGLILLAGALAFRRR
jgi:hypothetical protein